MNATIRRGLFAVAFLSGGSALAAEALDIRVLGNRADLVSGGDALVEIVVPAKADPAGLKVAVDGRDISAKFALRENGRVMALVTDLKEGVNALTAVLPDGITASLNITNFPNGGPIFAGEQILPWPCLPGAIDDKCNRPVTYRYLYKSGSGLAAYDPANPPASVPTTTTDEGKTVPYIVRIENGSQDRGQYEIAVLFDPSKEWQPWAPQEGWNGKTYITGGSGCGTHHGETTAPSVEDDNALARGFMVFSTALDHNTQNCNLVVQAESLMMVKERITEAYGPIRYTIGSGCSGGSIYQQQVANAYPGIFDGILPSCSFPDSFSTAVEVLECRLLVDYFDNPLKWGPGVVWDPITMGKVAGHPGIQICQTWINVYGFDSGANPRADKRLLDLQSCNIAVEDAWSHENPTGTRCSLTDYMVSIFGRRPQDGYANSPSDNVGIQYGFNTLMSGEITPAQFVDLNAKVGGRDINYDPQPYRTEADAPALTVTYQGGLVNEGTHMGRVAILDLRGHDVAEIHHDYRSYVMRARLDKALGHHDNQVIWTGSIPLVGDLMFARDALTVMDQWLAAIEADTSDLSLEEKIVKNKPGEARDKCTDGLGNEIPSQLLCQILNPYYAAPRIVAGGPFTDDVMKCQLKPLVASDYSPVQFTDAEWATLQATFPTGVCDWSQPGIEQQPTIAWMTYADGPGGKAMAAAPMASSATTVAKSTPASRFGGALGFVLLLPLLGAGLRKLR